MKKILIILALFISFANVFADTVIQMEPFGGVYRVPCLVNGAKMKFIFDTGANSVCLSMTMAQYLYDNDYITDEDIIGTGQSSVADGSIVDHLRINLKEITIGDRRIKNVEAIVISTQEAPLLLGQSVLKKIGKYTISGDKLIFQSAEPSVKKEYTEDEITKMFDDAQEKYYNGSYNAALDIFKILNDIGQLSNVGQFVLADCYFYTDKCESALEIFLDIKDDVVKDEPTIKTELYEKIAMCYDFLGKEDETLPYFEEIRRIAEPWSSSEVYAISRLGRIYAKQGNNNISKKMLNDYIDKYLKYKGYNETDCWDKKTTDQDVADLFFSQFFVYDEENNTTESYKYLKLAAAWGDEFSIDMCKKMGIYFNSKPYNYK